MNSTGGSCTDLFGRCIRWMNNTGGWCWTTVCHRRNWHYTDSYTDFYTLNTQKLQYYFRYSRPQLGKMHYSRFYILLAEY
jgi:hypothetical protein